MCPLFYLAILSRLCAPRRQRRINAAKNAILFIIFISPVVFYVCTHTPHTYIYIYINIYYNTETKNNQQEAYSAGFLIICKTTYCVSPVVNILLCRPKPTLCCLLWNFDPSRRINLYLDGNFSRSHKHATRHRTFVNGFRRQNGCIFYPAIMRLMVRIVLIVCGDNLPVNLS